MIPNIFHFIFLVPDIEGKTFGLTHYLAIKSCYCVNKPERIFFYYNHEPQGEWWEKAKPFLTLNRIDPPQEIFGNKLFHPAHQADVVRLQVLKEMGGIYLDIDTICIKPLHEFYSLNFAIGQQLDSSAYYGLGLFRKLLKCITSLTIAPFKPPRIHGLCNAVLLSEKDSPFINFWLDSYKTFRSQGRDDYWDEHSIKMPYELSKLHPNLLTKLSPYFFHFPLWDPEGLTLLFEKTISFNNAYVHHTWESNSWDKYLSKLTVETILNSDSTYNCIARQYLF